MALSLSTKVRNADISPEELTEALKEQFPELSIKNNSSKNVMRIRIKKGVSHFSLVRGRGGKDIVMQRSTPLFLDLITLGTIKIIEPFIVRKHARRVYDFLQERFSTA